MGYSDEWKKKKSLESKTGVKAEEATKPLSYSEMWKRKYFSGGTVASSDVKSAERPYDTESGAKKIERLKYYVDRSRELSAAAKSGVKDDVGGTTYRKGVDIASIVELQKLYEEYNAEFGQAPVHSSVEAPKPSFASRTVGIYTPAEAIDFEALLAEEQKKYDKAMSDSLYDSILADPNYEAVMAKAAESAKKPFSTLLPNRNRVETSIYFARTDPDNFTMYTDSYENQILPAMMTVKEKTIYNWYWGNDEYEKAEEYYQSIKGDLEERAHEKAKLNTYLQGKEHPGYTSVQSVVRSVYGTPIEAVVDVGKAVVDTFKDPDNVKIDRNQTADLVNVARGSVSEDMSPTGKFLYNTAMSGADSLLSGLSFGNLGGVTLALSAGSSAYNEGLDRGMSDIQAMEYGLASAVFEGIFESISLGRLLKEVPVDTWKDVVKNLAISMGVNASEEGATELANIVYDSIANGELSNWQQMLDSGMTKEEAVGQLALQVIEAMGSGALMGTGFSAGGAAVSGGRITADAIEKGKEAKNKGITNDLIDAGLRYKGTEAHKLAEKASKRATNYRVGRLSQVMTKSALQSTFVKETGDRDTAKALTDIVMGKDIGRAGVSGILANEKALKALNDVLGTSIASDVNVKGFKEEVKNAVGRQTDEAIDSLDESLRESVRELVRGNIVSDSKINAVLEDKTATAILSLRTGIEITDKTTVQEIKEAVTNAANDHSRERLALVYAASLDMGENGARGVVRMVGGGSSNIASAVQAFNAVYLAGKNGKAISEARNPYLSELSLAERMAAYEYGVMDSIIDKKNSVDEKVDDSVESGKETITPIEKLTAKQQKLVDAGKALGIDVVVADIKRGKENIDGLFDGKTLYVNPNPNSGNPMFTILKHELTHFIEKSEKYKDFLHSVTGTAAFNKWIKGKGFNNKQDYISDIIAKYKKVGKDLSKDNGLPAQKEMVANFVADTLFAEDNSLNRFVSELTGEQKHTFRDFINDLIAWFKKVFGNGEMDNEIAMLEKKYGELFRDAKNADSKAGTNSAESSYSISPSLERELDQVLNGTFKADKNEVYLGETSNFMTDIIGAEALSLYMPASKAYSSLVTEEEYNKKPYYKKQDNYHGIGKADFIEILEKSEEPILAFAAAPDEDGNKRQNRIILVTDKQILDLETGNYEYAVVVEEVDTTGWHKGKSMKANKTITIYPRSQLNQDAINAVIDHRILHTTKKGEHLFAGLRGSNPQGAIRKDVLKKNIAYFWANVKWESEKNKTFSTKEPELPSAFQLALEKAGYIDQDGHSKYMQEGEELSQKDASVDKSDDGQYSYTPPKSETSTRDILANMMDTVAESDTEKRLLAKYKSYLKRISDDNAEIDRLREARKSADKNHKKVFTSKIEALQKDISDTERRIANLEEMATIKRLVAKEREKLADEAHLAGQMAQGRQDAKALRHAKEDAEKLRKARDKKVEDKKVRSVKAKIADTVKELNSLLKRETKDKHVHFALQEAVRDALEVIDFSEEKEKQYKERLAEIDDEIAKALENKQTQNVEFAKLIEKRARVQSSKDNLRSRLEKIKEVYNNIHSGEDAEKIPPYFKEEAKFIEDIVSDVMKKVGDTAYGDMTIDQLEKVYEMYKIILTTVQNANKVFRDGKIADLIEDAAALEHDLGAIKKLDEERWVGAEKAREYIWNELTPYYAFNRIGSEKLMEYYWDLIRGQDTYARDVEEAKRFATETRKKYGYDKWDVGKIYTIKDKNGRDFRLTLKHMMSIYAYSKREQALDHMEKGGFFFNDKETFTKKGGVLKFIKANETSYKVGAGTIETIIDTLTAVDPNIISYVDEMQDYLTKMGEKGNEVTRQMWGINVFKEKVYFPLKSMDDFIYQANTPAETSSLKNDGMTKETKPHASNPIVLEAFDEVWDNHVKKMSTYHGFVIPIDNLNKLINYGTWAGEDTKSISLMLSARFGGAVNEYLNNFIKDLNGAKSQRVMGWSFLTDLVTKFKKTAVAASMSVVVQQPTAILRALSEVDAKYFAKLPKSVGLNAKWELIQKYAPVAIIKDIGGFDAGSGRSATDWLSADTKRGLDKVAQKFDDLTVYGAALGDRLGWGAIWTAIEHEIADTTDLEKGSEEFYEAVGKRFTEVIVKTQVYDSTLSRSGFMRGKDGLVKMAMAFKGEPTLSFNMLMDAVLQAKRGKISKKQMVRTISAVYASIIAATLAKSLIYALRDDDEDESYIEKYVQAIGGNIISDTLPITMLPVFSDIWSVFEGYDVERTDMSIIVDMYNAFASLDSESKTTYRKIEDLVGAMGAFVGVPAKNILRTFREAYNIYENIFDGVNFGDLGDAFKEGVTGKGVSKSEALYNAVMDNDSARIEIYRKGYKDENSYQAALKKSLRENDPRVVRSVEQALLGNYTMYNNAKRSLGANKRYGVKLVNEAFADERDYVLEKLDAARKARREGNIKEYNDIIEQLVERGYSRSFILKKLK